MRRRPFSRDAGQEHFAASPRIARPVWRGGNSPNAPRADRLMISDRVRPASREETVAIGQQLEQRMIQDKPLILGIGGTPRRGSSSERALAISLKAAEDKGARTILLSGAELLLPIYMPGQQQSDQASRLLAALRECHGIIISSPAYHGSISGLIKNALDYAEELRADARAYLDGIPVGCIASAGGWQ